MLTADVRAFLRTLAKVGRGRVACVGHGVGVEAEISQKFACVIQNLPTRNLPVFQKKSWATPNSAVC